MRVRQVQRQAFWPSCLVPSHFNSHLKWVDPCQGSEYPAPNDITCELK